MSLPVVTVAELSKLFSICGIAERRQERTLQYLNQLGVIAYFPSPPSTSIPTPASDTLPLSLAATNPAGIMPTLLSSPSTLVFLSPKWLYKSAKDLLYANKGWLKNSDVYSDSESEEEEHAKLSIFELRRKNYKNEKRKEKRKERVQEPEREKPKRRPPRRIREEIWRILKQFEVVLEISEGSTTNFERTLKELAKKEDDEGNERELRKERRIKEYSNDKQEEEVTEEDLTQNPEFLSFLNEELAGRPRKTITKKSMRSEKKDKEKREGKVEIIPVLLPLLPPEALITEKLKPILEGKSLCQMDRSYRANVLPRGIFMEIFVNLLAIGLNPLSVWSTGCFFCASDDCYVLIEHQIEEYGRTEKPTKSQLKNMNATRPGTRIFPTSYGPPQATPSFLSTQISGAPLSPHPTIPPIPNSTSSLPPSHVLSPTISSLSSRPILSAQSSQISDGSSQPLSPRENRTATTVNESVATEESSVKKVTSKTPKPRRRSLSPRFTPQTPITPGDQANLEANLEEAEEEMEDDFDYDGSYESEMNYERVFLMRSSSRAILESPAPLHNKKQNEFAYYCKRRFDNELSVTVFHRDDDKRVEWMTVIISQIEAIVGKSSVEWCRYVTNPISLEERSENPDRRDLFAEHSNFINRFMVEDLTEVFLAGHNSICLFLAVNLPLVEVVPDIAGFYNGIYYNKAELVKYVGLSIKLPVNRI